MTFESNNKAMTSMTPEDEQLITMDDGLQSRGNVLNGIKVSMDKWIESFRTKLRGLLLIVMVLGALSPIVSIPGAERWDIRLAVSISFGLLAIILFVYVLMMYRLRTDFGKIISRTNNYIETIHNNGDGDGGSSTTINTINE